MFAYGKLMIAAVVAAGLSGTLLVPSSTSFASPAALTPPVETVPQASPAPAAIATPRVAEPQDVAPPGPAAESRSQPAEASVDARELDCLTRVMLYEAGSEGRGGQLAVAHVVLNRVRSPKFPNSICSVVYQRGQFSSIRSFKAPRNGRWNKAEALARAVMRGETESNVGSALYFHATRARPAYVRSRTRVAQVGNHIFYR